jgi:hypothetical protein
LGTIRKKTTQLDELAHKINEGHAGSSRPWQGARVIITDVTPEPNPPGFYPGLTTVVTPHVDELSWLFEQLRGRQPAGLAHRSATQRDRSLGTRN